MKHPIRSQIKQILAQPAVMMVAGPIVAGGLLAVADNHRYIRAGQGLRERSRRSWEAFWDGAGTMCMFAPVIIPTALSYSGPVLDEQHKLSWGPVKGAHE